MVFFLDHWTRPVGEVKLTSSLEQMADGWISCHQCPTPKGWEFDTGSSWYGSQDDRWFIKLKITTIWKAPSLDFRPKMWHFTTGIVHFAPPMGCKIPSNGSNSHPTIGGQGEMCEINWNSQSLRISNDWDFQFFQTPLQSEGSKALFELGLWPLKMEKLSQPQDAGLGNLACGYSLPS